MAERNERRDHNSGGGPHLHGKRRKRDCCAVMRRPKLELYHYRCHKLVFWPAVAVLGMLHVVPPELDAKGNDSTKNGCEVLEPPLSPKARRRLRGRDGKGGSAGDGIWNGSGRRGL